MTEFEAAQLDRDAAVLLYNVRHVWTVDEAMAGIRAALTADRPATGPEPTCPTCAHRPHEPGQCKARYRVTFEKGEPGDPCLCARATGEDAAPRTEAGRRLLESIAPGRTDGWVAEQIAAVESEAYDNAMVAAFDDVQRIDRSERAAQGVAAPCSTCGARVTLTTCHDCHWKIVNQRAAQGAAAPPDVEALTVAMHDEDWSGQRHVWTACGVDGHRSYYPRVAAAYVARLKNGATPEGGMPERRGSFGPGNPDQLAAVATEDPAT